jgi:hypothetical protein
MRLGLILLFVASTGFTITSESLAPKPTLGPGAVIHMHEELFRAIDAGDAEIAIGFLHKDMDMDDKWRKRPCQIFFTDIQGKTVRAMNHSDSRKLMTRMTQRLAASEGSVKTTIRPLSSNCFSAKLSYAVLEIKRVYRHGKKSWIERFVSTSLVTHDNGWKLTHWHLSPAVDIHSKNRR